MRRWIILIAVMLSIPLHADDDNNADWRQRFDAVYKLDDGQCLKRIPKPWNPERETFYKSSDSRNENLDGTPDSLCFHWNGKLERWGESWGSSKSSLREVLGFVLQMQTYEFQLPPELESVKIDGDWIIDTQAEQALKLQALSDIIKAAGGPGVRFQQQQLSRQVIVASGQYAFQSLGNIHHPDCVHLYVGKPDKDEGAGGGSGTLAEFLTMLGSRTGMPVIDQTTPDQPDRLSWMHHGSTNFKQLAGLPDGAEKQQKIDELLNRISSQTGLQFKQDKKTVPVWVAEPTEPAP